jgi:hypothetical protein
MTVDFSPEGVYNNNNNNNNNNNRGLQGIWTKASFFQNYKE